MAKIVLNAPIQVISGDISGFVYRHQADGSVIIAKAAVRHEDRKPTPAQEAQMQKFKEASARYTRLMQEANVRAVTRRFSQQRVQRRGFARWSWAML